MGEVTFMFGLEVSYINHPLFFLSSYEPTA
jgi:hypothetical protein